MKKYAIITTIHSKTPGISLLERLDGWHVILVGDQKSVRIPSSQSLTFLSVRDQMDLGYKFTDLCPYNHYTRKNIGYLYAIQKGADIIYDTDDDNLPYSNWSPEKFFCQTCYTSQRKFINVYKYFSKKFIWPRGYPLDEVREQGNCRIMETGPVEIGVWQGLTNNDPDVDAIFRLLLHDTILFAENRPIFLEQRHYCPFNSQNTIWNSKAFPFLYLPATTSFRFTDILRGYIAQRLMWNEQLYLGFTSATGYQERNEHDLMKDFGEEVECYLKVKPVVSLLESFTAQSDPLENLENVYQLFVEHGLVKTSELAIFQAWKVDFQNMVTSSFSKRKEH